jgi:hypothetical protein
VNVFMKVKCHVDICYPISMQVMVVTCKTLLTIPNVFVLKLCPK